jgi:hypothetical protein
MPLALFNKKEKNIQTALSMFTGYAPAFQTRNGGVYEQALTVSCVHAFANHVSKFSPKFEGAASDRYRSMVENYPNQWMTSQQYLYRIATILECEHNAYIIPLYGDADRRTIIGLYPIHPSAVEAIDYEGEMFLRFQLSTGEIGAIEYARVGHLRDHYYRDDLFGEGNKAIDPVMDVIDTQNQGVVSGIKSSANIRFIGRLLDTLKPDAITKERDRFLKENLSMENNNGAIFIDAKFADLKQIDSKPWMVDPKQAEQIQNSVFSYFGTNEHILQNSYTEEEWNSYHEGKLAPLELQLSQVTSRILFTRNELAHANYISFASNRLAYMSAKTQIQMIAELFDRGLMTYEQSNKIFSLPLDPAGNRLARGEYVSVSDILNSKRLDKDRDATAYSGSQIQQIINVVQDVAAGLLPYESGLAIIKLALDTDDKQAKEILSNSGSGFTLEKEDINARKTGTRIPNDGNATTN